MLESGMNSRWEMIDVSEWEPHSDEPEGRRAKRWMKCPESGNLWLLKLPRDSRPTEIVVEPFAARLAHAVGLRASITEPCLWKGKSAILVQSFLQNGDELIHGFELLARSDPLYDPSRYEKHTLDAVKKSFYNTADIESALFFWRNFVRLLAFDAWLGNSDRHPANWGLIKKPCRKLELAPVFDTAACLGAELQDSSLENYKDSDRRKKYIGNCRSGFGNG